MVGANRLFFVFYILAVALFGGLEVHAKNAEMVKLEARRFYWGRGEEKNLAKALQLYQQAANMGDGQAQFITGGMYYTGKGANVDHQKAFYYLKKAAANGFATPESQNALAQIYLDGKIVPKNLPEAFKLLSRSAENGNMQAQNELGFMFFMGRGVERNLDDAFVWFRKAAMQGLPIAQYNVAMMWYTGNTGHGTDLAKAHAWFNIASISGYDGAWAAMEYIAPLMSEKELENAQILSGALFEKIRTDRSPEE